MTLHCAPTWWHAVQGALRRIRGTARRSFSSRDSLRERSPSIAWWASRSARIAPWLVLELHLGPAVDVPTPAPIDMTDASDLKFARHAEMPTARPSRIRRLIRRLDRIFILTVAAPTLIASVYFGLVASDAYIAESRFVVRSPQNNASP